MYRINSIQKLSTSDRFARIAAMGERVFHAQDLANIWQIKDTNTLYTTLKRYHQKGLLHRLQKGLYALEPLAQVDPQLLGVKAVGGNTYVSTETVLAQEGIISQNLPYITLVGTNARKFSLGAHRYLMRKLPERYLYNPIGINDRETMRIAQPARAVADLLFFNPSAYFDAAHLINWKDVESVQKQVGYPPTPARYR